MFPLEYYLITVAAVYVVGLYCLASKRDMIRLLIGIAILGNAANLSFVSLSAHVYPGTSDPLASTVVIVLIVLEACIVAVGLSITLWAYRHYKTLDVRKLSKLRW